MPTLILTLRLDPDAQDFFERLRQLHFPPARNLVPAHLTLFHQLPDDETVIATVQQIADEQSRFPVRVTGMRSLGGGVAYQLSSSHLVLLRQQLVETLAVTLTAQDRQRFSPHIVIQNKVSPREARSLLAALQPSPVPQDIEAHGLDLWVYQGGPWQLLSTFSFREIVPGPQT